MERSIDAASRAMLQLAQEKNVKTVWDRYEAQLPQCGFGETGLCCRHCLQGPCRIDPFGEGAQLGACGANADVMVARGLGRAIAAGTASHSGHAKHLAYTLLKSARGQAPDYPIADEPKLRAVARRIGIEEQGKPAQEVAFGVAQMALAEFSEKETPFAWAATTLTKGRVETFLRLGVVPLRPG